jgi:hypothetical protein
MSEIEVNFSGVPAEGKYHPHYHPDRPQQRSFDSRWREAGRYNYRSETGVPLFDHIRYKPRRPGDKGKTFKYEGIRPDGRRMPRKPTRELGWSFDADDYLWRLPLVKAAVQRGDRVAWAEGESDAMAFELASGITSTSHHGGAGNTHAEQAQWLAEASRVLLLVDLDPPGYRCAVARWQLLRLAGVSGVRAYLPAVYKDVTDHLDAGLKLRELRRVSYGELEYLIGEST